MGKASRRRAEQKARGAAFRRILQNVRALKAFARERCQLCTGGVQATALAHLTLRDQTGMDAGAVELGLCQIHADAREDTIPRLQGEIEAAGNRTQGPEASVILSREGLDVRIVDRDLRLATCMLFAKAPELAAAALASMVEPTTVHA